MEDNQSKKQMAFLMTGHKKGNISNKKAFENAFNFEEKSLTKDMLYQATEKTAELEIDITSSKKDKKKRCNFTLSPMALFKLGTLEQLAKAGTDRIGGVKSSLIELFIDKFYEDLIEELNKEENKPHVQTRTVQKRNKTEGK